MLSNTSLSVPDTCSDGYSFSSIKNRLFKVKSIVSAYIVKNKLEIDPLINGVDFSRRTYIYVQATTKYKDTKITRNRRGMDIGPRERAKPQRPAKLHIVSSS